MLVKTEPEKSRQEILSAESSEDILDHEYTESDLRTDWYLNNLGRDMHYDVFQDGGLTGIKVEIKETDYRIIGVSHGIADTEFSPEDDLVEAVREYCKRINEEGETVLYEQSMDKKFDFGPAIRMDDESWVVEEAELNGIDYLGEKVERAENLHSNFHWAKIFGKVGAYIVADRLGKDDLVANVGMLRDGEAIANSFTAIQLNSLSSFQKTL